MKNKCLIICIVALFYFFNGCSLISTTPDVLIKKDFSGEGIAVLNFSSQGNYLSSNIGKLAADKLTDALFVEGKFSVVDRANVNDAQASLEIKSPELVSADDIQKLGLKLKANYIVLGRVQQVSDAEFMNMDAKKELYISFRIISVKDCEVVGVATYSCKYEDNIVKEVEEMMYKIVHKIV